jgi:imidazole glycerol-phosphate synthase subunit HisH
MTAFSASPPPPLDLAVIDYGMGNLRSVLRAFERVGGHPRLVSTPAEAAEADALVFPGQGAIVDTMRLLQDTGLDDTVRQWIAHDRPFFGVCLGLQALFEHSEEGNTPTLGIFPGRVIRFRLQPPYKIPHMGWNTVRWTSPSTPSQTVNGKPETNSTPDPLLRGLSPDGDSFYFVHSYHVETPDSSLIWGQTDYGYPFTSAIRRGNCYATQFHPEKSQARGLQLYRNFLEAAALHRATHAS